MKLTHSRMVVIAFLVASMFAGSGCQKQTNSLVEQTISLVEKKGPPVDGGDGRKLEDFPEIADDIFKPIDGRIELAADGIKGRNTWDLWRGGDEQFWDRVAREELGL